MDSIRDEYIRRSLLQKRFIALAACVGLQSIISLGVVIGMFGPITWAVLIILFLYLTQYVISDIRKISMRSENK